MRQNYIDFMRFIIDFFCSLDNVLQSRITSFCSSVKEVNSSSFKRKSMTLISNAEQTASNNDKVGDDNLSRQL